MYSASMPIIVLSYSRHLDLPLVPQPPWSRTVRTAARTFAFVVFEMFFFLPIGVAGRDSDSGPRKRSSDLPLHVYPLG